MPIKIFLFISCSTSDTMPKFYFHIILTWFYTLIKKASRVHWRLKNRSHSYEKKSTILWLENIHFNFLILLKNIPVETFTIYDFLKISVCSTNMWNIIMPTYKWFLVVVDVSLKKNQMFISFHSYYFFKTWLWLKRWHN